MWAAGVPWRTGSAASEASARSGPRERLNEEVLQVLVKDREEPVEQRLEVHDRRPRAEATAALQV